MAVKVRDDPREGNARGQRAAAYSGFRAHPLARLRSRPRARAHTHTGIYVVNFVARLQSGKVAVYGAFDRTGCCVVKTMENGPFQAVIEVPPRIRKRRAHRADPATGGMCRRSSA